MPLTHFLDPKSNERIEFADAPTYFDEQGIMPYEAISILVQRFGDTRRGGAHLSPSMLNPQASCRREIALKRFAEYGINPLRLWEMEEGTIWHAAFELAGNESAVGQWQHEMLLPNETFAGQAGVRQTKDGVWEYEVFPGIWLSGVVDRLKNDLTVLVDHKTTRFAKSRAGYKADWTPQVNLYRFMVEDLTGADITEQWVWRMFRGSYERDMTFRKFKVPYISREEMQSRIESWTLELRDGLLNCVECQASNDQAALDEALLAVPADGKVKNLWGGKKCKDWCHVRPECDGLEDRCLPPAAAF